MFFDHFFPSLYFLPYVIFFQLKMTFNHMSIFKTLDYKTENLEIKIILMFLINMIYFASSQCRFSERVNVSKQDAYLHCINGSNTWSRAWLVPGVRMFLHVSLMGGRRQNIPISSEFSLISMCRELHWNRASQD